MKDLRILFLTRKGEGYVGAPQTYHEFEQEVGKIAECKWAGLGWPLYKAYESMDETVQRVMPDCDWVIDNKNTFTKTPKNRSYRVGVFLSDLHGKYSHNILSPSGFCDLVNRCGYDSVFMKYLEIHGTWHDPNLFQRRLKPEIHFLPWSVDTEKFKRGRRKKIDLTFIGNTSGPMYPLRQAIYDNLLHVGRDYKTVRSKSPKGGTFERRVDMLQQNHYVGERYADLLNNTRIMLFGCSQYRYPVQKYFEAAASGCLILANEPSNAKDLGFINSYTYVDINEKEWENTATWCLENWDQVKKIPTYAVKNIARNHTHRVRAREFLEMLR